jgi:hypothetical protein
MPNTLQNPFKIIYDVSKNNIKMTKKLPEVRFFDYHQAIKPTESGIFQYKTIYVKCSAKAG